MGRAFVSQALFRRACKSLVGGVNSPVRSFRSVGLSPIIAARGRGPFLYDADSRCYIDYIMSWGALILGQVHPLLMRRIRRVIKNGTCFGLTSKAECELAELIKSAFPSIQRLRLVNSGTEAVMSAIRLARGFTRRDKVLVFEGCYHGHSDGLLARAGSGLATLGIPASKGVPTSYAAETVFARYNDLNSVEDAFKRFKDDIACVLVEPVAGNMGVVPPEANFLPGLRAICDRYGALLIFDEVITGFRLAWGGAQEKYGIRADITTLGKIIGGGFPVGAYGGRKDIMKLVAPLGDVYQAGTMSGNPVVVSTGKAALEILRATQPYRRLEHQTRRLVAAIADAAKTLGIHVRINCIGSMFTVFFTDIEVKDYETARKAASNSYASFFKAMVRRGVLFPPAQWEACFVSTAHLKKSVLEKTMQAAAEAFEFVQKAEKEKGV